ncbi:hypothetical protein [Legionella fairfieldensis]|uniref:hypothetical protein n=1 Tax=Legionella fairfieldensis TaxID=45064 RepID=UPI00048AB307|nr:hypothetical protein [Legionella fairfieldensis]
MNVDELTFFELHSKLVKSSVREVSQLLRINCNKFTNTHFGLPPSRLKLINLKKASTLLDGLYNQPIASSDQRTIRQIKNTLLTLLPTNEFQKGKRAGIDNSRAGNCVGEAIIGKTIDYINGYEEGYTDEVLNSTQSSLEKGFRLGVLATRLNKSLNELFIKDSDKSEKNLILHDPLFLGGFNYGSKLACFKMRITSEDFTSFCFSWVTNNDTENGLSTTFLPNQDHYSSVFILPQESLATLAQCPSIAHSSLENDNTVDNFYPLEASSASYTTLPPNSTVTTTFSSSLAPEENDDLTYSQLETFLLNPLITQSQNGLVTPNINTNTNSDWMADSSPSFTHQEREESSLYYPVLPPAPEMTLNNNTLTVEHTQSPVTRSYSINKFIPWEKTNLNGHANKTISEQTQTVTPVAENRYQFFQTAPLPSSNLNPLTYAQGQTKKRKFCG